MSIKHIVFSGGGPAGIVSYGAFAYTKTVGLWKRENIRSIYGCSVGGILALVAALDYEVSWTDDYIIKRPWNNALTVSPERILGVLDSTGIYRTDLVSVIVGPLLSAKGISEDVTLSGLKAETGIDLHLITVDINRDNLEPIDLNPTDNPDLSVVDAISMSASYPILCSPIRAEGACYVDGGLVANFPMKLCMDQEGCTADEILGFNILSRADKCEVSEDAGLLSYLKVLIWKVYKHIDTSRSQPDGKYVIPCVAPGSNEAGGWMEAFTSEDARRAMVTSGKEQAEAHVSSLEGRVEEPV